MNEPELVASGEFQHIEIRVVRPEERQTVAHLMEVLHELRKLREEVRHMSEQTDQLTADVAGLTSSLTDFETAIASEIATLKASPAATSDPAVAAAITNIESLTARLKSDIVAASPALPASPAAPVDPGAPASTAATVL